MSEITAYLPHRDPFLFLERLEQFDREHIVGYYTFSPSEFFFKGHFPNYPLVPGVILVETMAQCGGAGLKALNILEDDTSLFFLASIEKAKFRSTVRPGDTVRIEIENLRIPPRPRMVRQRGVCKVNDIRAAEAEWALMIGARDE